MQIKQKKWVSKIHRKKSHVAKINSIGYYIINTDKVGVRNVFNPNYKKEKSKRRVSPFRAISFDDKEAVKYFKDIDLKFKCFTSHVYFRGVCNSASDKLAKGYCLSLRRESDLKISKQTENWVYASSYAYYTPTSYKAFVRWCKKQIVPEGTTFVMRHKLDKSIAFKYTYRLKKKPDGRCLTISCWKCQNSMLLRNLSRSYDTIRCNIDNRIIARKGEGIL